VRSPWRTARHARWSGLGSALALLSGLLGVSCREEGDRAAARNGTLSAVTSDSASKPEDAGTLPEDAEAGARSAAEWRKHLAHEELERRRSYDRRRLGEHQAVLKSLQEARLSFDAAASDRAVLAATRHFAATAPLLEKSFDVIDPHGDSSKVLPDYRKIVAILAGPYPPARRSALAGDSAELTRLGAELDARFRAIDAWLREAAESEDE